MVPWLIRHALPKDLSLVPSIHIRLLLTTLTPASADPKPSFGLQVYSHTSGIVTYSYKNIKINYLKIKIYRSGGGVLWKYANVCHFIPET